jgi:LuxR family maltose regulon positive regulatory protein
MAAVAGRTGLSTRFAMAKFRPPAPPATLVRRPGLLARLTTGADDRLTIVIGPAGAGKSVLLADWAATRPAGLTSWLSCDSADADPARFWAGFIEATQVIEPGFGADAADLLASGRAMSADVTAAIANDAAKLPAGSAVIVDDFHCAALGAADDMSALVELWPAETTQLVLSSRDNPPLRLHRLRVAAELCDIRGCDLYFSLAESHDLLARFGVEISPANLELLHQRSEGWAAALQMAAQSLRGITDPAGMARALQIRGYTIADYFISEILDQQPADVARFMLDTSILGELTEDVCAAVTGRPDAAALLRSIDNANLFLTALDDARTSFRYHRLVRQMLCAELHARDEAREQELHRRAAEWFEAMGETRDAACHYLGALQVGRGLALVRDQVVTDFMHDPSEPAPLDLGTLEPALLVDAPDQLLGLAADLLLRGDTARGGQYLDLLKHAEPSIPPKSRLAARLATMRAFRHAMIGQAAEVLGQARAAQAIRKQKQLTDDWAAAIPLVLMHAYTFTEDLPAAARQAAAVLAMPEIPEPVRQVAVPGALALAWFQSGQLANAAEAAQAADADARRLGFDRHFFAIDHLRVLAGLALERRDLDTAEHLTGQALSITGRRPAFEFLALLDQAQIRAARGQARDALAIVAAARHALAGTRSELLARADELEALLRLSLGDARPAADLASRLPGARRCLLVARIALASGDHHAARELLRPPPPSGLTPRLALVRRVLLAATAIERGDPAADAILGTALRAARQQGFLNTVVTIAPQVTGYLIEHAAELRQDPFIARLTAAAHEVRATQPGAFQPRVLADPLTVTEQRILELLPTSTYLQIADTLYVSRNTVKTHLRSIYQKLGATSRSQALQRAADLHLL